MPMFCELHAVSFILKSGYINNVVTNIFYAVFCVDVLGITS